jgi:opacity protein-like surface antigen
MTRIIRAAVVLAAIFVTAPADAQNRPVVSLQPPDPARWDAAGQVAWFGTNKSDIAPEWNDWSDAAAFAVTAGYYLTPHLKIDVDAATTTTGEVESLETLEVGGQFPTFRSSRHFFRSTTLSTSLAYQFLENAWFHPFVGVGIEGTRERARIESVPQFIPLPGVRPGTLVPGSPARTDTTYTARPIVAAGFKWYVSERAFIRADLRSSFSSDRAETVVWRTGVGFDW